jgi:hypothetical protein
MARWLPPVEISSIQPYSERQVAEALHILDDGWTVMHSYPWLRRQSQGGPLREGEADFVLFHREFGLLVLEVKGAEVSYDSDLAQWFQGRSGNYHPMKDPIRQAQQNLHKILDLIGQKHFPHGFALVFPDSSLTGCPAGGHSHILLGHDDMPRLAERIVRAARSFAADNAQPLSKGEADAILRALMPRFQIIPKLRNELKTDEERFIQLNQDQMDLLAHMLSTPKLLVEGVAGSGKTLLAVQRALDSASQGLKTLFLCYNKTLAQELRHHLRGSSADVHHFHELCHQLCQQAGIEFKVQQQATAQFWDEDIPEKAMQALEKLPQRRWQSLVIDEGQDFRESWWIVALSLLQDEPNDPIAIFYDQAQNLYDTSAPVPQLAKPYPLLRNCRNSQSIFGFCHKLGKIPGRVSGLSPLGQPVGIAMDDTEPQAQQRLKNQLDQWKDLEPRQIAVLSPYQWDRSVARLLGTKLTRNIDDWHLNKAPLFSTIKSFKGLEADAVVVIDLPGRDSRAMAFAELYVGFSRAKHLLQLHTRARDTHDWLSSL